MELVLSPTNVPFWFSLIALTVLFWAPACSNQQTELATPCGQKTVNAGSKSQTEILIWRWFQASNICVGEYTDIYLKHCLVIYFLISYWYLFYTCVEGFFLFNFFYFLLCLTHETWILLELSKSFFFLLAPRAFCTNTMNSRSRQCRYRGTRTCNIATFLFVSLVLYCISYNVNRSL